MSKKDINWISDILKEDDKTFYEKYLSNLTDEELTRFLENNPDFMEGLITG